MESQIAFSKTTLLETDMKKKFRSCVLRAAYLAQDVRSIAEAVKSLARRLCSPDEGDLSQLTCIGKYLAEYPVTANGFVAHNMCE